MARTLFRNLERSFIFPGSLIPSVREQGELPPDMRLAMLSSPTRETVAVISGVPQPRIATAAARDMPNLLFFYGSAMTAHDALSLCRLFMDYSCAVWVPDYIGYGKSSGQASERSCYETADTAYRYLTRELGVMPRQLIIAGWSLGAAVALDLAAREAAGHLILLSPFTSVADLVSRAMPGGPLVQLLLRGYFDNRRKISSVQCPILIGHGKEDHTVPVEMGSSLAASARAANKCVDLIEVDNASHEDLLLFKSPELLTAIEEVVDRVTPRGNQ